MAFVKPPDDIRSDDDKLGLEDFYALPSAGSVFLFALTGARYNKETVDALLPPIPIGKRNGKLVEQPASEWLLGHRRLEAVTWDPGRPTLIEGEVLVESGWVQSNGAHSYNLYRPPTLAHGDAALAEPWVQHLHVIYPEEFEEITNWFAHRVQKPGEKVNHAIVLGAPQGVGKDYILEALIAALGTWNCHEVSPPDLFKNYNPYVRSVLLKLNEAHDSGDTSRINRFVLNERCKVLAAAPPNVLGCEDKWIRRHYVPNVLGLVITTNHKAGGIHLDADDRRHLVCWSPKFKEDFTADYWDRRWHWLRHEGGAGHVAAWLVRRDLSAFRPGAPPRQTSAFYEIVSASTAPEDSQLADVLDAIGRPDACTLIDLATNQLGAALEWVSNPKYGRVVNYRMERCGYGAWRNRNAKDGRYKFNGQRRIIFVRADLPPDARAAAAEAYVWAHRKPAGVN